MRKVGLSCSYISSQVSEFWIIRDIPLQVELKVEDTNTKCWWLEPRADIISDQISDSVRG